MESLEILWLGPAMLSCSARTGRRSKKSGHAQVQAAQEADMVGSASPGQLMDQHAWLIGSARARCTWMSALRLTANDRGVMLHAVRRASQPNNPFQQNTGKSRPPPHR